MQLLVRNAQKITPLLINVYAALASRFFLKTKTTTTTNRNYICHNVQEITNKDLDLNTAKIAMRISKDTFFFPQYMVVGRIFGRPQNQNLEMNEQNKKTIKWL